MNIVLAISSFNGDEAALRLAQHAQGSDFDDLFSAVVVVDSGEKALCESLRDQLAVMTPHAEYQLHAGNLGSAGNLAARLRWANDRGADAVLAINADGVLVAENVRRMLTCLEGVAVVYPTHIIDGGKVDLSGRDKVPILPSRAKLSSLGQDRAISVAWGSSNGALYRLAPIRTVDLTAIANLWYGWEDLAIGLSLGRAGYRQVMSVEATQPTASDQQPLGLTSIMVSEKEPWTTYYSVRNLILLMRMHPVATPRLILRILRELLMVLLRDRRQQRYASAIRGLIDGIRGRSGQQIRPKEELSGVK